jgi:hypothetical protein
VCLWFARYRSEVGETGLDLQRTAVDNLNKAVVRTVGITSSCMRIGLGLTTTRHELPVCYEISFCRRSAFHEICYVILKKVQNVRGYIQNIPD